MIPKQQRLPDGLGDIVERFDHFSIAVADIRTALPLVDLIGGRFRDGGDHRTAGFRWMQFHLPSAGRIEFVQPLDPSDRDHFLVRFIARHGEGLHHLTFKVTDIGTAIERATGLGFDVVGINVDHEPWREAFIHPRSNHGVLVQLAQWTDKPDPVGRTVEAVLGDAGPG